MSDVANKSDGYESAANRQETVVEFHDVHGRSVLKRFQHLLHKNPSLVPLIVLVLSTLGLGIYIDWEPFMVRLGFARLEDVSNGSFRFFNPFTLTTALGAVSGWLVSRVKLPPFIVTLGMWQIVLAANYLYSRNQTIRSQDIAAEAPFLQLMGTQFKFAGATFTLGVISMILVIFVLAYALRSTAWGRHVYAVGDDPEAAELAGVNTRKTLMSVYMLAGFICAFAAWVMIGRFGSVSPSATTGVIGNIQAITAVVIGGISLFGGRGSILGALFGALIVGVFELGLRMAGADPQWTFLLIGALIIGAVTVDQWIREVSS